MDAPPAVFVVVWVGLIAGLLAMKGAWWTPTPPVVPPAVLELRAAASALEVAAGHLSRSGQHARAEHASRAAARARAFAESLAAG
jgi:hypothetical protein